MLNVEYRKATAADREKYIDFANMVFSCAHVRHDFKALIPKVYADGRDTDDMHNIAIREDGSIRGLVAVMPNEMKIGSAVIKTGYVGTVSTHPYGRGEGHMKKLMNFAIDGMQADGVELAMLGGQRQRYEYFGFTKGGVSRDHRVSKTNLRHVLGEVNVDNIAIIEVQNGDTEILEKCAAINAEKKISAKRTVDEFHIIANSWYKRLFAVNIDGEFAGYIIGAGDSFAEIMLYDVANVNKVIKAYLEKFDVSSVSFSTGEFEVELNCELAKVEESMGIGHPEMLRIFDFVKVIGGLMEVKASYAPMQDGCVSFVIDGKPMTIKVENGVPCVTAEAGEDAKELTAMEAQQLFLALNGQELYGRLPFGWAPLPLYLSHADAF